MQGMARLVELGEGRYRLEGDLNLHSVAELARSATPLFSAPGAAGPRLELDLAGVTQSSSAAVALMLDWVARARAAGGSLRIENWPEAMMRIARFSNLAELFGLPQAEEPDVERRALCDVP